MVRSPPASVGTSGRHDADQSELKGLPPTLSASTDCDPAIAALRTQAPVAFGATC